MEIKSYKKDGLTAAEKTPTNANLERKDVVASSTTDDSGSKKNFVVRKPTNERPGSKHQIRAESRNSPEKSSKRQKSDAMDSPTRNVQERGGQTVDALRMQELESMIDRLDPNYNNKKKAMKDVDFIFDPKSQKGETPYHQEGNMEFYTKENEAKRKNLKSNPLVIEALNNVINLYQFDMNDHLTKTEYTKMHTKIAKAVRSDLKDKALGRLVEQDWKHDSKSKGYMEKEELFNSIFELGDVWTPDIDAFQYIAFFQRLYQLLKGEVDSLDAPETSNSSNPYNILH